MKLSAVVCSLLFTAMFAMAQVIVQPTSGTAVQPGAPFDFEYNGMADYSVSSYNYTVFLFTEAPTSFADSQAFAQGYYFGRFSNPNYPGMCTRLCQVESLLLMDPGHDVANPYPTNPAPSQLWMPDFSKNPGGWGAGSTISGGKFYLTVLEEYGTGQVSLRSNSECSSD